MMTFASYNKFENRTILLDTMLIILANVLTSVFAGIIVFATLGNIAMELGRPIQKVVVDGTNGRSHHSTGPGIVLTSELGTALSCFSS